MTNEYLKPMLDVGSPRVFNCNVITRQILAADPNAQTFFACKPLNNLVLIKDSDPNARSTDPSIGTKLYLPFNENEIYEGGRTIFLHERGVESALIESFGQGALPAEALAHDLKIMRIMERLPSLDPFLLKDVYLNEKIPVNQAYFEVSKELWDKIEAYILLGFEPLAKAAFPDALASDALSRKLVEKIWEGRDIEGLKPLILALRLSEGQELATFAAWKGINFYGFQFQAATERFSEMVAWLKDVSIPVAAGTSIQRAEYKTMLDSAKKQMMIEWRSAEKILQDYQKAYNTMFISRQGSNDFVNFLKGSQSAYWTLGNALGKIGHASYCWEVTSKRYPGRKVPWEQTGEFILLLSKIFLSTKKTATSVAWS